MLQASKGSNPKSRVRIPILTGILVISAASLIASYDISFISDDGAHLVNVARNIMQGNGIATSMVYYDQHYLTGQMPAPLSSFPPGYPLLIALVAMLGVSPYLAAFLVSLVFFELSALLIYRAATLSGFPQGVCIAVTILWLCLPIVWFNILSNLSETSHVALILASFVSLLRGERSKGNRALWFASAGLFAGLAFTIRYLGAFYIISLACVLILNLVRRRTREAVVDLALAVGTPVLFVGALLYRNIVATSSVHGIYISGVQRSLPEVARYFYWAVTEIVGFSWHGLRRLRVAELLLIIFLLASSALFVANLRRFSIDWPALRKAFLSTPALLGLVYLAVTVGIFAYWTWGSRAGVVNSRYLIPVIPFALLLGPSLLTSVRTTIRAKSLAVWAAAAVIVFAVGQVCAFSIQWERQVENSEYAKVRCALGQPFLSGEVAEFLTDRVPAEVPILSNSSQILGAVIDRPVLGLTPAPFSPRVWTVDEVQRIVASYRVSYVLFFPKLFDPADPMNSNQPFFFELKNGKVPTWLKPTIESDRLRLYAVE